MVPDDVNGCFQGDAGRKSSGLLFSTRFSVASEVKFGSLLEPTNRKKTFVVGKFPLRFRRDKRAVATGSMMLPVAGTKL
jgi:hypothetical protein